jgi:sulfate adenylyltransferase subunit 2
MVSVSKPSLSAHLRRLEAEAIGILRETLASFRNPVLLYSIGKDSSVVLHLALKAFAPGRLPFPCLHIATGWDFRDMLAFRERRAAELKLDLIVHTNPEGLARGINPIDHGSQVHMHVMATEALKQALDAHGFDAAIGGARRDEEKARAKERVFSHRSAGHIWDPRNQRPELWGLFNTRIDKGEGMRVFPLSNWTEFDVWDYIAAEEIPLVPLYYAALRPVLRRDGMLIMRDDDRMPLKPDEQVEQLWVRFRTMGDLSLIHI